VETENLSIGVKEFGGRRDRQGPEEGEFGRVVEKRIQNRLQTVLQSSSITIRPGSSVDEKRICAVCLGGS
jgi:hypothetical protein